MLVHPGPGSSFVAVAAVVGKVFPFGECRMVGSGPVLGDCMRQVAVAGMARAQWGAGTDLEVVAVLEPDFLGHHLALPAQESGRAGSRTF